MKTVNKGIKFHNVLHLHLIKLPGQRKSASQNEGKSEYDIRYFRIITESRLNSFSVKSKQKENIQQHISSCLFVKCCKTNSPPFLKDCQRGLIVQYLGYIFQG